MRAARRTSRASGGRTGEARGAARVAGPGRGARRRTAGLAGSLALGGALVALASLGAPAASADAASSGTSSDDACTVEAETGDVTCYPDVATAVAAITGDPVTGAAAAGERGAIERVIDDHNTRVARSAAPSAQRSAAAAAAADATASRTVILGAVWKDKGYSGSAKVLYAASGNGCGNGTTYGFPNARDFGMNDTISSVATYNGCAVTLYADANYRGSQLTIQSEASYVGSAMNDKTSSLVFRPRG